MDSDKTIGILGHSFIDWAGGRDFLWNVTEALLAEHEKKYKIHLILPMKGSIFFIRDMLRRTRKFCCGKRYSYPAIRDIENFVQAFDKSRVTIARISLGENSLLRYCRMARINVLIPVAIPFNADFPVPWVGWIADFQHKHLPEMFSSKEITHRDLFFDDMLSKARIAIVNSTAVLNDLDKYYPMRSAKVIALPFNAGGPRLSPANEASIREKYAIGDQFILCSNQFWKHKDHITLFKAFALLRKTNKKIQLVCTGEMWDPRCSTYMDSVMKTIADLDILVNVKLLGLIPKVDQLGLMCSSKFLVQPSLCEGGPGGGAVYEAIGLGVKCLISDIPVNLEIKDQGVLYFRSGCVESLANKMAEILSSSYVGIDKKTVEYDNRVRRLRCCGTLFDVIVKAEELYRTEVL
jgi:glycosyltransferase involved in cell wall biosynthesis